MNSTEKKYAGQIAQMMRAARKYRGFTQADVAKGLGITQGTLSKLEQGTLVISTPLWFEFCEHTRISPRSFLQGYIDFPEPLLVDVKFNQKDESHFRLPKRYAVSKGSTVRGIRAMVDFARTQWGEKKFGQYLDFAGVDPDFFLVLPNQVNLQFSYDLIQELKSSGLVNRENFRKIAQEYADPEFHGSLSTHMPMRIPVKDVLNNLMRDQYIYQSNFDYTTTFTQANEALIESKPASFISSFDTTSDIARAFCDYRTFFFESVLRSSEEKSVKVKHTQCAFLGEHACQFAVQY